MRKLSAKELLLLFLDSFVGLEYKHKQSLYRCLDGKSSIKKFITDNKDYIVSEIGSNEYNTLINSANDVYLDYVIKGLDKREIIPITIESEGYPERLKQTNIPPLVLYAKGNIELLNEQTLGVVGSRKSLPNQIAIAERYCEALSINGFTLVTGTAEGVDSVALRSATKNKAKVISVMANGFDHIYPASNIELINSVINNGGLVVTEYTPEVVSKPYHFPIRNRIIAGLSDGVLIVSGAIKSGTMYTAEYAEAYGKHLFAIPYNIGVASGAGCNDLIKRGAMLTDTPDDILLVFNKTQAQEERVELSPEEQAVIDLLKEGELHIEQISKKLNQPVFVLSSILSQMEIKGLLVKTGVNVYGLIK